MIKAIIFDFDGVIVDSEKKKLQDLKLLLKSIGINSNLELTEILGKKTIKILDEFFPGLPINKKEKIINSRRKILMKEYDPIIPGVVDFINKIRFNKKLVICSGSQRQIIRNHLKHFGIKDYFQNIISGDDFKKSKPDPEAYITALEKLNLKGKEVIVIEDSQAGIDAAHSANCRVFGIDTYNTGLKNDKVFSNFKDIETEFKKNII